MKKFLETMLEGAAGLLVIYVVGKAAYEAGKETGREEARYEELKRKNRETESAETVSAEEQAGISLVPDKKPGKLSILTALPFVAAGKRRSVLRNIVQNPEDHRFEAFVEGNELHVRVGPR